jgi:hypothetical protein
MVPYILFIIALVSSVVAIKCLSPRIHFKGGFQTVGPISVGDFGLLTSAGTPNKRRRWSVSFYITLKSEPDQDSLSAAHTAPTAGDAQSAGFRDTLGASPRTDEAQL